MIVAHKLLVLVAAFYFFEPTNGAASIQPIPANPRYPGKCFIAKGTIGNFRKDILMSVGEKRPAPRGNCFELDCNQSGLDFSIGMYSCIVESTNQPDCRHVTEDRLPYPKCCPKLQCDSPLTYPISAVG